MTESCDIYIKSVVYEGQSWLDDPDTFLELVYNTLSEIQNFYFVSVSLNMSEVYNVNLQQVNYESMIFYLKGVKYKQDEFLTLASTKDLIDKIKQYLGYIEKLSFGQIEIRSSIVYSDRELGIIGGG